jgi:aspartate-semialdehyde dehydrogenase
MSEMKVAVIGASGKVGQLMIDLLGNYFEDDLILIPVASKDSVGKKIDCKRGELELCSIEAAINKKPQLVFFSAGSEVSRKYAPRFVKKGSYVIDNSSAWRMESNIPLIVPEVNGGLLMKDHKLISNPNCSTIQLVMVLDLLEKNFGLDRVVVSSYQSVSGAGKDALLQMEKERKGEEFYGSKPLIKPIDQNVIPQIDTFLDNGYSREEWKIIEESRKILGEPKLRITATCVRVPVKTGHSESVNIKLKKPFDLSVIRKILNGGTGITVVDEPGKSAYPMPIDAEGNDEVFVGRIRDDESTVNGLNLWIVSDNLRKGAATNALQIAKLLSDKKWLGSGKALKNQGMSGNS